MSHKQPVKVSKSGSLNGHSPAAQSNPEVVPKAKRRTFSTEYKLQILAEADACTNRGDVGALSRQAPARQWRLRPLASAPRWCLRTGQRRKPTPRSSRR
jgi:hypothetical protein